MPDYREDFIETFEGIQKQVHQTARDKGWWDDCIVDASHQKNKTGKHDAFVPECRNFGEAIALMHSELSEALEFVRHGDGPSDHIPDFTGVEEELADTIIRIMDWAAANNLRVAEALIAKAAFNEGRPVKYGGKKF